MADNVFSPGSPAKGLGASKPKQTPQQAIEAAARRYKVPANVLFAMAEATGDASGEKAAEQARDLSEAVKGGASLREAIELTTGDADATKAIATRANALKAERSGQTASEAAPEDTGNSTVGNIARDIGGQLVRATGGVVEAAGAFIDEATKANDGSELRDENALRTAARRGGRIIGKAGADLTGSTDPEYQKWLAEGGIPDDANLFDPSTYPSLKSLSPGAVALQAAGAGASMVPVVAAGIAGGPLGAAAVGSLMSGGEGVTSGREAVEGMTPEQIEGTPAYKEAIEAGATPDQARGALMRSAEAMGGAGQAGLGAIGGAATAKILKGGAAAMSGAAKAGGAKAAAGKIAGTAAASALEEGTQEVAEGIGGRMGVNAATGLNESLTEGTLAEFALGAGSGGAMGAGAGAIGAARDAAEEKPETTATMDSAPQAVEPKGMGASGMDSAPVPGEAVPLSAPAPDAPPTPPLWASDALPGKLAGNPLTPSGLGAMSDTDAGNPLTPSGLGALSDTGAGNPLTPSGLGAMSDTGMGSPLTPSGLGALSDTDAGNPLTPSGLGALSGLGAQMPPAMPTPAMPDAAPIIPAPPPGMIEQALIDAGPAALPQAPAAPRFPDQKPGAPVRFATPSGDVVDGVFIEETPDGAAVRIGGQEMTMTPAEFDKARDDAKAADEAAAAAAKPGASPVKGKTPAPITAPAANDAGTAPEPTNPQAPATPEQDATPTKDAPDGEQPGSNPAPMLDSEGSGDAARLGSDDDAGVRSGSGGGQRGGGIDAPGDGASDPAAGLGVPDGAATVQQPAGVGPDASVEPASTPPSIEPIPGRPRASVLKNWTSETPPVVEGMKPLKFDAKAGGWIFSAKQTDKVRAAVDAATKAASLSSEKIEPNSFRQPGTVVEQETPPGETQAPSSDAGETQDTAEADSEGPWKPGLRRWDDPRPSNADPAMFEAALSTDANRPMKDLTNLDYEGFDDKTREDGQNSPGKREARGETARWAKAVAKALREGAGYTPTMDRKGKPAKVVSHGYSMSHEPDETRLELTAPNGLQMSVSMRPSMTQGKALTLLVQHTGEPAKPGYSRAFVGGNEYLSETMTPAEAAARLAQMAMRLTPRAATKGVPAATETPPAGEGEKSTPPTVAAAAEEAAPEPTDAQKEAENYKTGKAPWNGLRLSIENKKGAERTGTGADGKPWSVTMPAHYGRILGTTGADGDHVDFYMGDDEASDFVLVVDQIDPDTGKFDEHKVMLGFRTQAEAEAAYKGGFSDGKGRQRMAAVTVMDVKALKRNLSVARWDGPWSRDLIEKLRDEGNPAFPDDAEAQPDQDTIKKPEPAVDAELRMPAGFTLGSVKKMNAAEADRSKGDPDARGKAWARGDFHAVISRQSPFSVVGGYGKTRAEAINDAIGRAAPTTDAVKKPEGLARRPIRADKALTARGREIPVDYAIVEIDDLIPSQLDDGRDNPSYPKELQPRDRSGNKSGEQIRKIAADLKPELLGESPQAGNGAPIVGGDGLVESGNGRTLALRRAYEDGTADGYQTYLKGKGYPVDGMKRPMLVRIRQGDMSMSERAATAREANERDTAAMSTSEQGMADSATMSPAVLDLYRGGDVDSAGNRDFVRAFLGQVVAPSEMGSLIRDDGTMTQDAVRRVQAALMARAYGDSDLIGSVMESTETSIKAIGGALIDTAARWAQMRDAAKDGVIASDMDQTAALLEAVRVVDRARRAGRKVDEFVGQGDMFSGDTVSPMGKAFLTLMFRDAPKSYGRPTGRDSLSEALTRYTGEAMKTQPGADMLGGVADPAATLDTVKGKRDGDDTGQAGLFGAGDARNVQGDRPAEQAGARSSLPSSEAGTGDGDAQAADAGRQPASEGLTPKAEPKALPDTTPAPSGPDWHVKRAKERVLKLRRERPGSDVLKQAEADLRRARMDAFAEDTDEDDTAPAPPAKPAGLASSLSADKQARLAELQAKLAAKVRSQVSSGLDPEYITIGGEIVALYMEAGARKFGDMLRAFADATGLTMREAQEPMRAAYNHVRDNMDLAGEDVSDMDDGAAVMAEVRAALAEEKAATETPQGDTLTVSEDGAAEDQSQDDNRADASDAGSGTEESAGATEPQPRGVGEGRPRDGQQDADSDRPGRKDPSERAERGADAGRADLPRRAGGTDSRVAAVRNHVIAPGGLQIKAGDKTRARNSIKAIETLRALENEGRDATEAERQTLALYGGAGTLAAALPNSDGKIRFEDIAGDLDRLLTPEEKASLTKTSQYAFYTAEPVLRSMWSIAQQLGFNGGKVFEPGMGVGGFIGTAPEGVNYRGLELDPVTAKIAAKLYPQSRVENGDFIKTKLPRDFYDMVIGNPPFSRTQIKADPDYPQGFMIHDYFFAKSLDSVRPGGLLMFVTSAGTMNKMDSAARDYLADSADLVGAIRLPNTAFKENGTEVTTDIIILRKRLPGEREADPAWRSSSPMTMDSKDGGTVDLNVNDYFHAHPEMILGEQGAFDTLVGGPRVGVRPFPGSDLDSLLNTVAWHLPKSIMSEPTAEQMMDGPRDDAHSETKTGSFYMKDGDLWQFDGQEGRPVQGRGKGVKGGMPKGDMALVKSLLPIRDALRAVYAADLAEADATAARKKLNAAYDAFVAERGPINKPLRSLRRPSVVEMEGLRQQAAEDARASDSDFDIGSFDGGAMIATGATMAQVAAARREAMALPGYSDGDFNPDAVPDKILTTFPNIDAFGDDPENFRLRAIEKYDDETGTAAKSLVFTENAVRRSVKAEINSPEDALLAQLAETGRIDMARIAEASGSTPQTVRSELAGKVFQNPVTGEYETRAKYLSGNVRVKLREAQDAAQKDPDMQGNVEALEAVQPVPVPHTEIAVPLGAHWFDAGLYSEFAKSKGLTLEADFKRALGIWTVTGDNLSGPARNEFGTADLPFGKLMGLAMNNKPIRVKRTEKTADGGTRTWVDEEATQAGNDKAAELRALFEEWLWSDQDRAVALEDAYNEAFNADVAPSYDGAYLTTPGIHASWSWRPHQTAVVARILQDGNTYMAHTVGAGKTSAMIGAGMEARRLGLARKPMYAVPNHMLAQFATEFQHQYPLANILIADERRFEKDKRKQFVADAALGDYDAIIITHSAMGKIPNSEAATARVVEGMLGDLRDLIDGQEDDDSFSGGQGQQRAILGALKGVVGALGLKVEEEKGTSTAKKIAQMMEQAEQRLASMTNGTRKDDVFTMDEIGADMLFVDEAHLFRKLSFATTNGDIKGIDSQGSQMSMDLFIKTRIVEARNPGRGLIFASGTPLTNTMAELYSVSRYLQPAALEARGVAAFDAWAATFGEVASELEQDPAGGYKEVSRFSRFVNTPELSLMVRQVMDVVSGPDLDQYVTRPKLKGGSRSLVVVEATPEQQAYQQTLGARMEAIAKRKGPPTKGDDILLSVTGDGRLSAIDPRLVDPSASGDGSKLERMIQNIYRRWKAGANAPLHGVKKGGGYTDEPVQHGPSTQIVFSTLGIEASRHNPDFSVHRYVKASLVRAGVPANEIVLSGDLKTHAHKQRAFNDMNEGRVRILVGSKSLFTGVNAQRRIAAIHNLDPLWFPADDEQRNGRGIRQGNMNPEIEVLDYSTKGTYDATMWQMMGRKAGFIEAFFRGDPTQRDMEDMGEASVFEQAKAMTTRDPRVLELTDLRAERDKLARRAGAVDTQRARLRAEVRSWNASAARATESAEGYAPIVARVTDLSGDKFIAKVAGKALDKRKDFGTALIDAAEGIAAAKDGKPRKVGEISGFDVMAQFYPVDRSVEFRVRFTPDLSTTIEWSEDPVGLARRAEAAAQSPIVKLAHYKKLTENYKEKAAESQAALAKVKDFAEQPELDSLNERVDALHNAMLSDNEKKDRLEAALEGKPEGFMSPAEAAQISSLAFDRMKELGLSKAARVSVGNGPDGVLGRYYSGKGLVRIMSTKGGWRSTLDHEVIHLLRDSDLWGRDQGLFTGDEWRALVRAARADKALMARMDEAYGHLTPSQRVEEAVAEMFTAWAQARDEASPLRAALDRVRSVFRSLASALRGEGFIDGARAMERIASGEVGGRGPDGGAPPRGPNGRFMTEDAAITQDRRNMADMLGTSTARAKGWLTRDHWKQAPGYFSSLLTDAMGKSEAMNVLALVPGRPLFNELGKRLAGAQSYLGLKTDMDTLRDEWHAKADATAQEWASEGAKDTKANAALMDLMHDTTLAGIDPSMPDTYTYEGEPQARKDAESDIETLRQSAARRLAGYAKHRRDYARLKAAFDALPDPLKATYRKVRDSYTELADEVDKALLDNIDVAVEIATRRAERAHAKEIARISDEGLEGLELDEAKAKADSKLATARDRGRKGATAQRAKMRAAFEGNRARGPYFPLARFGTYFVTIRDEAGKVISFSRFEKKADQDAFVIEATADHGTARVDRGALGDGPGLKPQVDPVFVAEVQQMLDGAGADAELMDSIWQHWLETLPDMSMRKSQIHRKGRAGFNTDAFRAYGKAMFHGAHQLARLRYGLKLGDALDTAEIEAGEDAQPERAMFIVKEMRRRHQFTMNPTGNPLTSTLTGIGFIWYLGMSPAAALVNVSQTTMMGVPILGTRFRQAGTKGAIRELSRAFRDFTAGKGEASKSGRLSDDEKAAMAAAYEKGTVDRTQSHDLASVADSGVEYSATRERVMRKIGFLFHHAERMNREVTFLAAYRLARAEGQSHAQAVDSGTDVTWKTHFDYQNTARPRIMQGDISKVVLLFRSYSVNMLWRLFRDAHQTFAGATPEERAEARGQLIGISLSMMAHAGIKGTWGFGILMMMLGLFFPGGDDDAEKWLQDALLLEGDDMGAAAWNWTMGLALNGAPTRLTGMDLTNRIGMPNLWFRGSDRALEGSDAWAALTGDLLGPIAGIGGSLFTGMSMMKEDPQRGAEKMVPKVLRDLSKAQRYAAEGVTTFNGDVIVENVNPIQLLGQASGFTPAKVSERYKVNNRLKNAEKRIMGERARLHKDLGDAVRKGKGIDGKMRERLLDFNRAYPEYPVTNATLRASIRGRQRASDRNEAGVSLNPKLNDRLRAAEPPSIFG